MRIRTALPFFLLLLLKLKSLQAAEEKYVYVIYYEDTECNQPAVSVIGFPADDDVPLRGRQSSTGLCSQESLCLINYESAQCQRMNVTKEGTTRFSIDDAGLIFQCDTTNTDGQCSFLDQCYASSIFPSCHFRVALARDIEKNTTIVLNEQGENLQDQIYEIFYSDSECSEFEGIRGLVSGPNDWVITNTSITCKDAMSCLYFPEGEACQAFGFDTNRTQRLLSKTQNDGQDAYICNSGGVCKQQNPTTCVPSPIHPTCYYRTTSAANLFKNPADFFTSNQTQSSPTMEPSQILNGSKQGDASSGKIAASSVGFRFWMMSALLLVAVVGYIF